MEILTFFEAIIEGEIVSDWVLPPCFGAFVEWKIVGYILIDLSKGKPFFWRVLNAHGDQCTVGVWWSDQFEDFGLILNTEPREIGARSKTWWWCPAENVLASDICHLISWRRVIWIALSVWSAHWRPLVVQVCVLKVLFEILRKKAKFDTIKCSEVFVEKRTIGFEIKFRR